MTDPKIIEPADYTDAFLRGVLESVKSIAVVGASADPVKASFFVMKYLRDKGYTVIPVNPKMAGQTISKVKVDPWLLGVGLGYRF